MENSKNLYTTSALCQNFRTENYRLALAPKTVGKLNLTMNYSKGILSVHKEQSLPLNRRQLSCKVYENHTQFEKLSGKSNLRRT